MMMNDDNNNWMGGYDREGWEDNLMGDDQMLSSLAILDSLVSNDNNNSSANTAAANGNAMDQPSIHQQQQCDNSTLPLQQQHDSSTSNSNTSINPSMLRKALTEKITENKLHGIRLQVELEQVRKQLREISQCKMNSQGPTEENSADFDPLNAPPTICGSNKRQKRGGMHDNNSEGNASTGGLNGMEDWDAYVSGRNGNAGGLDDEAVAKYKTNEIKHALGERNLLRGTSNKKKGELLRKLNRDRFPILHMICNNVRTVMLKENAPIGITVRSLPNKFGATVVQVHDKCLVSDEVKKGDVIISIDEVPISRPICSKHMQTLFRPSGNGMPATDVYIGVYSPPAVGENNNKLSSGTMALRGMLTSGVADTTSPGNVELEEAMSVANDNTIVDANTTSASTETAKSPHSTSNDNNTTSPGTVVGVMNTTETTTPTTSTSASAGTAKSHSTSNGDNRTSVTASPGIVNNTTVDMNTTESTSTALTSASAGSGSASAGTAKSHSTSNGDNRTSVTPSPGNGINVNESNTSPSTSSNGDASVATNNNVTDNGGVIKSTFKKDIKKHTDHTMAILREREKQQNEILEKGMLAMTSHYITECIRESAELTSRKDRLQKEMKTLLEDLENRKIYREKLMQMGPEMLQLPFVRDSIAECDKEIEKLQREMEMELNVSRGKWDDIKREMGGLKEKYRLLFEKDKKEVFRLDELMCVVPQSVTNMWNEYFGKE